MARNWQRQGMKNMIVLIDTNVALDFLTMRQLYYEDTRDVIRICAGDKAKRYIAFHSVPNIFYILRKSHSENDRRAMLEKLCCVLQVAAASHERVCDAIEQADFADLEDCLQEKCAKEVSADYIVTRNLEDFKNSQIKAISPREFVEMVKNCG